MGIKRQVTVFVAGVGVAAAMGSPAVGDTAGDDPQAPEVRSSGEVTSLVVRGEGELRASASNNEDIETFLAAEEDDLSEREMLVLRAQEQFIQVTEQIIETHRETYVEHGIGQVQDAEAWISFTERPPQDTFDTLATLPIDVRVRWGLPAGADEIEAAMDFAVAELAELLGEDAAFSGAFGPEGIDLTFGWSEPTPSEAFVSDVEETLLAVSASTTSDGVSPVPVTVSYDRSLMQATPEANQVFGGGQMRLASNGSAQCTSGFSGTRAGQNGIMTARHCPDRMRFGNNPGWIQFAGIASHTPAGNAIDLQFHRTLSGTTAVPRFRAGSLYGFRTVGHVASTRPPLGAQVCKWGMTTGYGCTQVHAVRRCFSYSGSNLTYCGLVAATQYITGGGDSGGPWFWNRMARGVHQGRAPLGPSGRMVSVYTEISMASTYMNTTVRRG